jgi:hypothetical protein
VVEVDELEPVVALGRSEAHADNAAFTLGFDVSSALGKVVAVDPAMVVVVDRVGSATP